MGSPPEYIVTDPHGLRICCEDIAASEQVGFDTEFVGEESYQPQLCLLQLATPRALYVIDPFDCGPLEELWSLLASPTRLVIVHAGREEVRFIQGAAGRAPRQLFDVQIAAGLVGFNYPVGYGPLVHNVLGRKLRKNETLTDWRRRPLSQGQLRYAFDDVRDLLALWRELEALLKRRRRMSWAQEEFAAWTHRWLQRSTDNERWRKLKGIGGLDPARLAIVRELYFWREQEAARRNRPTRTILRDDLLVKIARVPPSEIQTSFDWRGVAPTDLEEIRAAVARAARLPQSDWPAETEPDREPHAWQMATQLLSLVLTDWCFRHQVAVPLAATSAEIRRLVRAHARREPVPRDSIFAGGWRQRHILPLLREILEGSRAVRLGSLARATPLDYDRYSSDSEDHAGA